MRTRKRRPLFNWVHQMLAMRTFLLLLTSTHHGMVILEFTSLDTFLHVTDLTGRETLVRVTGGMKVKADREESSPYAAMQAAKDIVDRLKELKINAIHIKLRACGGTPVRCTV